MKLPEGLDPNKIRKIVKAIVICDDEEVWQQTEKDIQELLEMMSNNSRQATIIEVEAVE